MPEVKEENGIVTLNGLVVDKIRELGPKGIVEWILNGNFGDLSELEIERDDTGLYILFDEKLSLSYSRNKKLDEGLVHSFYIGDINEYDTDF